MDRAVAPPGAGPGWLRRCPEDAHRLGKRNRSLGLSSAHARPDARLKHEVGPTGHIEHGKIHHMSENMQNGPLYDTS